LKCLGTYRSLAILALLLPIANLQAQQVHDTLHTVHVKAMHKTEQDVRISEFAAGQQLVKVDSNTMAQYSKQSIADLLTQQMPVFVKAYSFNGLATISFRGASTAQSQVLWQGVPIQNAALGVTDIAAMPVLLTGNVQLVYGGSGALLGSGNAGGALLLTNPSPKFGPAQYEMSTTAGVGSFGQRTLGAVTSYNRQRWYTSLRMLAQAADNNYPYTNSIGNNVQMPNGKLKGVAANADVAYKINNQQQLQLSAWVQDYNRQIPPALFEQRSTKQQQDQAVRLVGYWQHHKSATHWYVRTAYMQDDMKYTDSMVALDNNVRVGQLYSEIGWKHQFARNYKLLIMAPASRSFIPGNDTQIQTRVALATALSMQPLAAVKTSVQFRAEQFDDKRILLPGVGAEWSIKSWLTLRANLQRSYRMPTLNELYYFPGGNAHLKPEEGWSQDAGYTLQWQNAATNIKHEGSLFNRYINNWILWLGGAIWTPHNIAEVHSRGTETYTTFASKIGNTSLHLGLNTSYILSTTTSSYMPGDGSIGKQIPYTPRYNGRLNLGITWRNIQVNYNHTYTGYRFITTDESTWLAPYQTGNIYLAVNWSKLSWQPEINIQCNNLWNESYMVAGFRPMPGLNWMLGFKSTIGEKFSSRKR
jgi:vitamin B12 transporter